ncbi:hypothetical protein GQ600_18158 [Phytophthora cactorum]|nr:hypothetical protein GQ600_18158 [Phytophthora cactorum]
MLQLVDVLAVEEEISLVTHESNHEGAILDWLLNAKENEIIVLYCVAHQQPCHRRESNGVKSRYPTIYSRWCAVGLWAAIVQFGAGCGKESFCPAVDRRACIYFFAMRAPTASYRHAVDSQPRTHASWTRVLLTAMLNRLISQHHTRISPGMPPWGI